MFKKLLIPLFLVFSFALIGQDIPGSKDHPILSRYPGSSIKYFYQKDYNELQIPKAVKKAKPSDLITVKGKHTSILYKGPAEVATLQLFRNYETAIVNAGGKILFQCKGKFSPGGCDDYNQYYGLTFLSTLYESRTQGDDQYLYVQGSEDQALLVAVFDEPAKRTYVEIGFNGEFLDHPSSIQLEVIEEEKMAEGLVTAKQIEEALNREGKIALYGIYFDTGKASLKERSKIELAELTAFLNRKPGIKVYIVGHTDDTGLLASNLSLSEDRASTVTQYLIKAGIASERLLAKGVGPLSPVASNENDRGRSLNRRVEIVKMLE